MDADHLNDLPARELIERLSSSDPIPGGGSASAIAGAMGAALVRMVVALSAGRPAAADHEGELTEIAAGAAQCQSELLNLGQLDAVAYHAVVQARRLPKGTDLERRTRAVQVGAAVREATRTPLEVARVAEQVLRLAERLAPLGNRNAVSDVGVGALLAGAALRGAVLNVRINLPGVDDEDLRARATDECERFLRGLDERERALRLAVEARL